LELTAVTVVQVKVTEVFSAVVTLTVGLVVCPFSVKVFVALLVVPVTPVHS
jgi:hypothetical protein